EDEAPSLQCDVLHGWQPGRPAVGGGRAVDLDALRVHRHPQQRHIVFPADDCSKPTVICIKDRQCRAIAKAPDKALHACRHELAMLAAKAPIWSKKKDRAIERADIALDHSDYELYTTGPRYRSHALNCGSGYINRTFPIPAKILPTLSGAHTNACTKVESHRIARDKRFGKNRDLHTLACRVCNEVGELLEGLSEVPYNGSSLHHGRTNDVIHGSFHRIHENRASVSPDGTLDHLARQRAVYAYHQSCCAHHTPFRGSFARETRDAFFGLY